MTAPFSFVILLPISALLLGTCLATPRNEVGNVVLSSLDDHKTTVDFTYSGPKGPEQWGSLDPAFFACSTGKSQSPVDIIRKDVAFYNKLKPLNTHYNFSVNAKLLDDDINIGIHYEDHAGVLVINGKNYTLMQMHWHSPSEHRIDGVQYPAELHLVHKAADGNASVISVLYQYGRPDPIVNKLMKSLELLGKEVGSGHEDAEVPVRPMDFKHIGRKSTKYYRYIGSFTTPPCTENVIWSILGKVRSISKEQVIALKAPLKIIYKNNARPVQPLNRRRIELYERHR